MVHGIDVLKHVIAGHSASEDVRERAYDPAIHLLRKNVISKKDGPAGQARGGTRSAGVDSTRRGPFPGHKLRLPAPLLKTIRNNGSPRPAPFCDQPLSFRPLATLRPTGT